MTVHRSARDAPVQIMERYSLTKDWRSAGFYETENHRQIARAGARPGSAPGA